MAGEERSGAGSSVPSVPTDLEGLPGVLGGAPGHGGAPPEKPLYDPQRPSPGLARVQECRGASEGAVSCPEEHSRPGGPANDTRAGPETDAPGLIILEKNNYWIFKQWTYKRFFNNDISKKDNLRFGEFNNWRRFFVY